MDTKREDWSDDELRAAVAAYRQIQRRERAGERGFKRQIYRELGARFGRTDKAFEFRMQNISAVLALMGRQWILGLKPAKHIGTHVAARLERCINEVDGNPNQAMVVHELEVQEWIRRPATQRPAGQAVPVRMVGPLTWFARDPAVKAWVLRRARGVCECCVKAAPFTTPEGTPYLEIHHLRPLAEGGSDRVSNAVALCPNCHRRFHYGTDQQTLKQTLLDSILELEEE